MTLEDGTYRYFVNHQVTSAGLACSGLITSVKGLMMLVSVIVWSHKSHN